MLAARKLYRTKVSVIFMGSNLMYTTVGGNGHEFFPLFMFICCRVYQAQPLFLL